MKYELKHLPTHETIIVGDEDQQELVCIDCVTAIEAIDEEATAARVDDMMELQYHAHDR